MKNRILIVDDNQDSLTLLEEILTIQGEKVIGKATNGKRALELYKQLKPDLVLMDIVMPEHDGYYGFKMIKEFDPSAKVIMVTGYHDDWIEKKLLTKGAYAIIFKPYEPFTLLSMIEKITRGEKLLPF